MNPEQISAIIPSYNGAKTIKQCLEALMKQTLSPVEVIVVVDGSEDHTDEVLQRHFTESEIKIIHQTNQGRAKTRNKGCAVAKGDLLFFLDDDIVLDPGTLERHLKHHQSNQKSFLIGSVHLWEKESADFMNYRKYLETSWYKSLPKYPKPMTSQNLFVTAAHLSLPKVVFDQLDGFDEELKDAEDLELGLRALEQDIPIYFDGNLVGWHHDPTTCQQYIKRRREYEVAHQQLLKTSDRYRNQQQRDSSGSLVKLLMYRLLAFKFWVQFIDSGGLKWLPVSLRYRLYSAIIWALGKYYKDVDLD